MKRGAWIFVFVALVAVAGSGYWAVRYMGMRAVLSRELSLFRQVHTEVLYYQKDTGEYPASLEVVEVQPYLQNLRKQDWDSLREGKLVYVAPPKDVERSFPMLRMWTPWGDVVGHPDGGMTYGWKELK